MITKDQASRLHLFYHGLARNKDGTPLRARRNGQLKVWVRRPDEWQLPAKHGLRQCFYLTQSNAPDWFATENEAIAHGILFTDGVIA